MKFNFFAASVLFLSSISSFASGKNVINCGWNENDDQVTIRQDSGGQFVALFSILDHGTSAYKVELVPVPSHRLGAGVTYQGNGITFHMNTDVAPSNEGTYATLSLKAMNIENEEFHCNFVN
jgi:hypothetical protein